MDSTNATTQKPSKSTLAVCKIIHEDIKRSWGNGWRNLGDPIKEAILTERVFYIFTSRDEERSYTVKEIRDYHHAVLHYFGFRD